MIKLRNYQNSDSQSVKELKLLSDEPMVRNSFTKLLHSFLLQTITIEELSEFYQGNFLECHDFKAKNVTLLQNLWNEKCFTPSVYISKLIKNMELRFIEQKRSMYPLLNEFFANALTKSTFLSDLQVAVFQLITSEIDIRKYILNAVNCIPLMIFSDALCSIVSTIENECYNCRIFTLTQGGASCNPESILDVELSFVVFAKMLPAFFGLSPFTNCTVLFEEQNIESRLQNYVPVIYQNGKCIINGDIYGEQNYYSVITTGKFPEIGLLSDKDPLVTFIEKDYFCPIRKRIILKKNTVYGSPLSIISIVDNKVKQQDGRYDSIIQKDMTGDFWLRLDKKQEELIKRCTNNISVKYDPMMQILFIEEKPVVGGVQAKILNLIFKIFVKEGRNIFEWREFATIDEFICDPYSTGLSTRLNRLITVLDKMNFGCRLVKCNRGKYRLLCDGTISYDVKR